MTASGTSFEHPKEIFWEEREGRGDQGTHQQITLCVLCSKVTVGRGEIRLEKLGLQIQGLGLSTHNVLSVPNLKELFYHNLGQILAS